MSSRMKPAVAWWGVARTTEEALKKASLHATFSTETRTLCGLKTEGGEYIAVRFHKKRPDHFPCGRCSMAIERRKDLFGIEDEDWPFASFSSRELANA